MKSVLLGIPKCIGDVAPGCFGRGGSSGLVLKSSMISCQPTMTEHMPGA